MVFVVLRLGGQIFVEQQVAQYGREHRAAQNAEFRFVEQCCALSTKWRVGEVGNEHP